MTGAGGTRSENHGPEPPARPYPGAAQAGSGALSLLAADYEAAKMPYAAAEL